jgi:serine/threonine-protein kinase
LAALVWGGIRFFGRPGEALRVLVLPPVVEATAGANTAAMAAANVEVAVFRGLAAMKDVVAVDAPRDTSLSTPRELAAAVAADDVLSVSLRDTGSQWQVAMRRIAGADGRVAWAESFDAPRDEPLTLANAINARLRAAFPERRAGSSAMEVRPGDYAAFVRQHSRFIQEGATGEAAVGILDTLAAIRASSPRFLESYLLESKIARMMFESKREPGYLDRAQSAADGASRLAPDDPRVAARVFEAAISAGDLQQARAAIAELRRVRPGSVELLRWEAKIAEREGESEVALAKLRAVVEREPAREYMVELIDREYDLGLHADARAHLNWLLERFPGNNYGRSKLAELELVYGDAARAAELYEAMVKESPGDIELTNLALARELLGDYDAAARDLRQAVAASPSDATCVFNLADCEKMAGRPSAADSLYQRVLALIASDPASGDLSNLRMRAQSLAHLGEGHEAVRVIQEALREDPENAWTFFAAAVVYTAIGERTSALVNVRQAAAKGVQPRWFGIRLFDTLRDDPEFVALLGQDPVVSRSD